MIACGRSQLTEPYPMMGSLWVSSRRARSLEGRRYSATRNPTVSSRNFGEKLARA